MKGTLALALAVLIPAAAPAQTAQQNQSPVLQIVPYVRQNPAMPPALPEPFGFKAGMTKDQVIALIGQKGVVLGGEDAIIVSTSPKPYSGINDFALLFSENGLVKIDAYTDPISVNSFGDELKSAFAGMNDALTAKYGKPANDFDFLQAGSIWKENQDWMMGLLKNERTLLAGWENSEPYYTILLEAQAKSSESGVIKISYEFPGCADYVRRRRDKRNLNL